MSAIAEVVEQELGRGTVFLDEWYEHWLAGIDADVELQKLYGNGCELAVACISERYGNKPWTRAEHRAIRARLMQTYTALEPHERMRVLPIRVGCGDVPGILFNDIVPDVRRRSPAKVAELVIERLRLIVPNLRIKSEGGHGEECWPEAPPRLPAWPIADHLEVRQAFELLLTRDAPWRFLPVRGPSETGKSHLTRQMLASAVQMPEVACGRFDFKGTTDVDQELRMFVEHLDVPSPHGANTNERLRHVLDAIKQRAKPTLLILDTYEAGVQAQEWVTALLLCLMRAHWLRVVIAGQSVPDPTSAVWAAVARPVLQLTPPSPEEWLVFGRPHKPEIDLDFVKRAHKFCAGRAGVLAQLLGPGS